MGCGSMNLRPAEPQTSQTNILLYLPIEQWALQVLKGVLSAYALSPWVSAKLQDLILPLALFSCVNSGTTSLIPDLLSVKSAQKAY